MSERKKEVLRLIVSGLNNEIIADTLMVVSIPTVKTHVHHIFETLDVSGRTRAAVWAVRNGIE